MAGGTSAIRQRAIDLFQQDISQTEIASRLGVSRVTINQWAQIYKRSGADALLQRGHKGRSARLSEDQRREITSWLSASPQDQGLNARRWTGRVLAKLIRRKFGVAHSPNYCLALCRAMRAPMARAYRPPREPRARRGGLTGRPAKISGLAAETLRNELRSADRHGKLHGWTRRELVEFIRVHSGAAYASSSIDAVLGRLGVSLEIIPERQRRIETRPRAPKRQRGRRLTPEQLTELCRLLTSQKDIATWSAPRVKAFIRERFGVTYAESYIPPLLQQIGILIRRPSSGGISGEGDGSSSGRGAPKSGNRDPSGAIGRRRP